MPTEAENEAAAVEKLRESVLGITSASAAIVALVEGFTATARPMVEQIIESNEAEEDSSDISEQLLALVDDLDAAKNDLASAALAGTEVESNPPAIDPNAPSSTESTTGTGTTSEPAVDTPNSVNAGGPEPGAPATGLAANESLQGHGIATPTTGGHGGTEQPAPPTDEEGDAASQAAADAREANESKDANPSPAVESSPSEDTSPSGEVDND